MTFIQATILILVAITGTAVVLTRNPTSQAIVLSFYGLFLSLMFVAFQAPTVALSQVSVCWVVLPLLILVALARIKKAERKLQ